MKISKLTGSLGLKTPNSCLLLCLILITASCRASGPGDTYTTALLAANDGKYAEANGYLGSNLREAVSGLGTMAGSFNQIWDERTKKQTIQSIDVVSEDIRGDDATVTCNIHYRDGSIKSNEKVEMKREKGHWKLMM